MNKYNVLLWYMNITHDFWIFLLKKGGPILFFTKHIFRVYWTLIWDNIAWSDLNYSIIRQKIIQYCEQLYGLSVGRCEWKFCREQWNIII